MLLNSQGGVLDWGCGDGFIRVCTTVYGSESGVCSCVVPSTLVASQVSAGWYHDVALKPDGTVVSYGCRTNMDTYSASDAGQCNTPTGLGSVIQVSGGFAHNLALKADGTVVAWGCGQLCTDDTQCPGGHCTNGKCDTFDYGQCVVPPELQ